MAARVSGGRKPFGLVRWRRTCPGHRHAWHGGSRYQKLCTHDNQRRNLKDEFDRRASSNQQTHKSNTHGRALAGKKRLLRNSRDTLWMAAPFLLWAVALVAVYGVSIVRLKQVRRREGGCCKRHAVQLLAGQQPGPSNACGAPPARAGSSAV